MKKLQKILFCSLLTGIPPFVYAQNASSPIALTVHAGLSEYKGDMGNGFLRFDVQSTSFYEKDKVLIQKNEPGTLGASLSVYLTQKWDLSFSYFHGEWGYHTADESQFFFRRVDYYDATLRYKIAALQGERLTTYACAGFAYRSLGSTPNYFDLSIPLGLGVNWKLTESIQLNFQSNIGFTNSDVVDGLNPSAATNNDLYWNHSIGIGFLPFSMFNSPFSKSNKSKCPKL